MNTTSKQKPQSHTIIPLIHEELKKQKNKGGKFRKTTFHVHTPASHDFTLISNDTRVKLGLKIKGTFSSWNQLNDTALLKIAREVNLLLSSNYSLDDFAPYLGKLFKDSKELLAYLILAHSLLCEEIELCLVTDHNTLKGFDKLEEAINILSRQKNYPVVTRLEKGIEISCSDKNHIVGILDRRNNQQDQQKSLENWLEDNIISETEGTIRTSYDVLKMLKSIGAIGYIAHINSSDIFNKDYLSGTYKRQLFNSNLSDIIGVNSIDNISRINEELSKLTKKKYHFIIDNDAHYIEKLKSGFFYLKGDKLNFEAIKSAFNNYELSILFEANETPKEYIEAIYIDGKGFLKGKNTDHLILTFSPDMNAFIGGRGSGKSTVLNTIGFMTSQYIRNRNELENILAQGTSCIAYRYNGITHYVMLHSSDQDNNRLFSNNYFETSSSLYHNNPLDKRKKALNQRFQVFHYYRKKIVIAENQKQILDAIFTPMFSTNNLVNIAAEQEELTEFIDRTLFRNKDIKSRQNFYNIGKGMTGLFNKYKKKEEILEKRKTQVDNLLHDYNQKQEKKLRIIFNQKEINDDFFNWYDAFNLSTRYARDDYFLKYAITFGNLVAYLQNLSKELGNSIETLLAFKNWDWNLITSTVNVKHYFDTSSTKTVDKDLKFITDETSLISFLTSLRIKLTSSNCEFSAKEFLRNYFRTSDIFTLEFNVNNRESMRQESVQFKDIISLSMGQKVVAMLSFLLTYDEYLGEFKPFIVDQPEDNLDNQYIYKNLVADLKKLKSRRQIILATHNSTIVMNSGCEQVIVMSSNNQKGWCETKGYISTPSIVGHVVNILEGGTESIINKVFMYQGKLHKKDHKKINLDTSHGLESSNTIHEINQTINRLSLNEHPEKLSKLLTFLENLQ